MNQVARPTGVSVIAWGWIITGGLMGFSGVMALLALSFMPAILSQPELESQMPAGFWPMMSMFRYFTLLVLVQLAVAVVAVVAGIQFLKLRSWARTVLEVIAWLSVIYVIGFGVFWLFMWSTISGQLPQEGAPFDSRTFEIFGLVMGAFVTLVFAVSLGITIKYLRGKVVRGAIQHATE